MAGYAPVVLAQVQQELPAMQFATDATKYMLYEAGKQSPTFIRQFMPVVYNTASLSYGHTKGNFVAAQGATTDRNITFSTEGKTRIGRTDLWGSFSYTRVMEDSTRFAHQTRYETSRPYYYGSPGNISYRRAWYKASVLGQHTFLQEHLPVVAGIDYNVGSHFSTNDPRGNINDYQATANMGSGYTWHKRLTATVQGYYGYGSEVLNVSFKNPAYQASTVAPTRHNWVINGYSEAVPKLTLLNFRTGFKRSGVGGSMLYTHPLLGTLAITGKKMTEKENVYNRSSAGFDTLSYYSRKTTTMHIIWTRHGWVVQVDYDKQKGEDHHVKYLANNYQYRSHYYNLQAAFTTRQFNYGLQVNNNAEERMDGISGNHVSYEHLTIQPSIGWNHMTRQQHHWGATISAYYTASLRPFIYTSPINVGYFTREVIYYDYYYNAANSMGGKMSLQYTRHFKGFYAGLKGTVAYTAAYTGNSLVLEGARRPGKDRAFGSLAIQFYF
jgi:hypothetical protein